MRTLEAFWTRFGVDEDRLRQWPPQRIKDYLTVMKLEHQVETENQRQQQRAAGVGSRQPGTSSEEMTELAFKAMKQQHTDKLVSSGPVGPHPNAEVRAQRAKLFE